MSITLLCAPKTSVVAKQLDLNNLPLLSGEDYNDVIAIDLALNKLTTIDTRQGRIVELRYFGGLTAEEAAEALGVSVITVQRDWAVAKAWLHGELVAKAAVLPDTPKLMGGSQRTLP